MRLPDFSYEIHAWRTGNRIVAGLDEVGRGSFAGPVVAGCVIFKSPVSAGEIIINDSKKLSANQRNSADLWIRENAFRFGIGMASVVEINTKGIKKATETAFRRALTNCFVQIDHLLVDAFFVPRVRSLGQGRQTPIIKGDCQSFSIASASILAKVYRDSLMTKLAHKLKFAKYGWDKNKGYGTKSHIKAIQDYGISKYHRIQFVRTAQAKI